MTPAQAKSIESLRNFMTRQLDKNPDYGDTLVTFEVTEHEYFVSVWARTDMINLPQTNALRSCAKETWQFFVGKRGGVTVSMCPQSFFQFYGKRAFGMLFKPNEAKTRTHYPKEPLLTA